LSPLLNRLFMNKRDLCLCMCLQGTITYHSLLFLLIIANRKINNMIYAQTYVCITLQWMTNSHNNLLRHIQPERFSIVGCGCCKYLACGLGYKVQTTCIVYNFLSMFFFLTIVGYTIRQRQFVYWCCSTDKVLMLYDYRLVLSSLTTRKKMALEPLLVTIVVR
jgi:hypothetical protein